MPQQRVIQGFERAKKSNLRRMVIAVEAMDGEGKTTFGLSAPGPIALFDMDIGLEGVIDKWVDLKEIQRASFSYKDATSREEWIAGWEKMKKLYYVALADPHIKTLLWDTETEGWDLIRMARLGSLSLHKDHAYKWGPVNTEFRDLIRSVYETDKNLILLRKMKEQYIDDNWTGKYDPAGFKDIRSLIQVRLRSWRDEEGTFGLTVMQKCRQNASIVGMDFVEPMNTFPFVAAEVFGDTSPEEWE